MVEEEITYLCMAENSQKTQQRKPFKFLEDIKERFRAQYGARAATAIAFAMNQDFSRILQKQMDYYNHDPNSDNITRVRGQLVQVKEVMVQASGTAEAGGTGGTGGVRIQVYAVLFIGVVARPSCRARVGGRGGAAVAAAVGRREPE